MAEQEWKMVFTFPATEEQAVQLFTAILGEIKFVTGHEANEGASVAPAEQG